MASYDEQMQMRLGRVVCACCGYSKFFKTGQEAFDAGWDAPPAFTQIVVCNRCPSAFVMLGKEHPSCPGSGPRDD